MAADLFAAAAEERLQSRAPLAARLRPRTLDEVVGQRDLLAPGPAAAGADRGGPALLGDPLGAAGHREDHDRPAHRRRDRQGVRADERGQRRGEGRPRGRRAGPEPARRARPGDDPVPRRGAPVQQDPAGRAAPARRGRPARPRRRDHREPVLLADLGAAQPVDAVPARAARARRTCGRSWSARSRTRPAGSAATGSTIDDDALDHLADRSEGDARHALTSLEVAAALDGRGRRGRRSRSSTPRPRSRCGRCATATTSTTTSSPRSSRASAARTSTPASTGSRGCSRRARTRASSPAGS